MAPDTDVVVVGAGLAGLTTAVDIANAGHAVRVLEARQRVGGRMLTVTTEDFGQGTAALDLGATWVWSDQPLMLELLDELGLRTFAQHAEGDDLAEDIHGVPPYPIQVEPLTARTLRVAGGVQQICEQLAARLPDGAISFSTAVTSITADGAQIHLAAGDPDGNEAEFTAHCAVVALPPRLALQRITFEPSLPEGVARVLELTPTWMARTIKCVVLYEEPFWRSAKLSGTVFSTLGPLREIQDASPQTAAPGALWGFFSGDDRYREMQPRERAETVFDQLERIFGPPAGDPLNYFERDWSTDPNTNDEVFWVDEEPLAYGDPVITQPQLDGRLMWAGTETAPGGGHMEGALASARRAAEQALAVLAKS